MLIRLRLAGESIEAACIFAFKDGVQLQALQSNFLPQMKLASLPVSLDQKRAEMIISIRACTWELSCLNFALIKITYLDNKYH